MINKLEFEHFSNLYGETYTMYHEFELSGLLKYEALLMQNLYKTVSMPNIPCKEFFVIINSIE